MIVLVTYLDQNALASSGMSTVSLLLLKLFSVVLPMTIAWFSVRDYTEGRVCWPNLVKTYCNNLPIPGRNVAEIHYLEVGLL